jgi:hypothetical protein
VDDDLISIRPGVGMLGLFPHMKYQPWYALGELVDNAIQSYMSNRTELREVDPEFQLQVTIDISRADGGSIIVSDNAAGIAGPEWERAFKVAERPADNTGLSQFGVGMKAACCWFANEWSVRSSALGSDVVRSVMFDVPAIVESGDESLRVAVETTDLRSHFTVIEMSNLHRPVAARTLGKIRTYLGGIYRQFLRDGEIVLAVNEEPVVFQEPAVLDAPRYNDRQGESHVWRKDVDILLESGRRVTGFVAVREVGQARQAGLALLYRKKVVTGSGEEMYKPEEIYGGGNSFASQRLFGELRMDDFSVTYTKDALVWYDEEEEFIEALRADIDAEPYPLLKQANGYRKRDPELAPAYLASQMLDSITESFEIVEFDIEGASSDDTFGEEPRAVPLKADSADPPSYADSEDVDPVGVDRIIEIDYRGTTWSVDLRLVAAEAVSRWLTVQPLDGHGLVLTVNQAHPFMRAYCEIPGQELEPVWRVAIALGLAQEMARLGGAKMPGLVTENVNALLRSVLSHKS